MCMLIAFYYTYSYIRELNITRCKETHTY
jgi:hypothetical protein